MCVEMVYLDCVRVEYACAHFACVCSCVLVHVHVCGCAVGIEV